MNQRHPLDDEPDELTSIGQGSEEPIDAEQVAARAMRRLSLMAIAVCAVVNIVTGVIAVNASPFSTLDSTASAINRITMFGLLFGFIGLLVSFRAGIISGWGRKREADREHEFAPDLADSPWPAPTRNATEVLVRARSPMSLALLFYLITLAAVLSACLQLLRGQDVPRTAFLTYCVVGIVLGFVLGGAGGAFVTRRATATLIGSMLGLPLGGVAGVLALINHQRFEAAMIGAFCSCAVLIFCVLLATRFQKISVV